MKLFLPLIAILFAGSVVLVDAADDAARAAAAVAKKTDRVETQASVHLPAR